MTTPQDSTPQGLDLSAARSTRTDAEAPAGTRPDVAGAGGGASGGQPPENTVAVPSLVFDVNEEAFNDLVALSNDVPVVVSLLTEWSEPSKDMIAILESIATSLEGRIVVGLVDIEKSPRVAQLFQAQSVPTFVAIVKGQPIPLFQGTMAEPQVREYVSQLLQVAAQAGVTKTAFVGGAEEAAPAVAHPEALAAMEAGDLDTAAEVYRKALAEAPADAEAKVGLARVGLLSRVKNMDATAVRAAAAEDSKNVAAALDVADLDLAGGHVEDAFNRLLTVLTLVAGEDRESLRVRLLELFDVVGAEDPRVVKARARLMRALF